MGIKKFIIIILIAVVTGIIIILPQIYSRKRGVTNYKYFNNAVIDGTIDDIYIRYKGVGFTMDNGSKFVFYPYKSELNGNKNFESFADKGDKIVKAPNSDTLTLIKGGNIYRFTFAKFP